MQFPLHLIIEYAHKKPWEIKRAITEFFGNFTPQQGKDEDELLLGLFGEWLIYEYRQITGNTFLAEYILKNPDNLPQDKIDTFTQIISTQKYSEFQILNVEPPHYIELEDIVSGTVYKVFDKLGSKNMKKKGLIRGRISNVNGRWYLAGSNPMSQ